SQKSIGKPCLTSACQNPVPWHFALPHILPYQRIIIKVRASTYRLVRSCCALNFKVRDIGPKNEVRFGSGGLGQQKRPGETNEATQFWSKLHDFGLGSRDRKPVVNPHEHTLPP